MTNFIRETMTTREGNHMGTKREVGVSQTLEYVLYFALGILEIFLAFRLVLKFLGANPTNTFTDFVYSATRIFVLPFSGIFPAGFNEGVVTTSVFEPATLIAMIVYAIVAWGVVTIIRIISGQRPE